jgi:hypothetical protein
MPWRDSDREDIRIQVELLRLDRNLPEGASGGGDTEMSFFAFLTGNWKALAAGALAVVLSVALVYMSNLRTANADLEAALGRASARADALSASLEGNMKALMAMETEAAALRAQHEFDSDALEAAIASTEEACAWGAQPVPKDVREILGCGSR